MYACIPTEIGTHVQHSSICSRGGGMCHRHAPTAALTSGVGPLPAHTQPGRHPRHLHFLFLLMLI